MKYIKMKKDKLLTMKFLVFFLSIIVYFGQNVFAVEFIQIPQSSFHRDDVNKVVIDKTLNLMWQDDESVTNVTKNWEEAVEYCHQLTYIGFHNWRLPNVEDLISLIDEMRSYPAINTQFKNVFLDWYWTNSTLTRNESLSIIGDADGLGGSLDALRESINGYKNTEITNAFGVGFKNGQALPYGKSENFHIRCVRDNK